MICSRGTMYNFFSKVPVPSVRSRYRSQHSSGCCLQFGCVLGPTTADDLTWPSRIPVHIHNNDAHYVNTYCLAFWIGAPCSVCEQSDVIHEYYTCITTGTKFEPLKCAFWGEPIRCTGSPQHASHKGTNNVSAPLHHRKRYCSWAYIVPNIVPKRIGK